MDVTYSRTWEAGLVGGLSVLTAAMLVVVEITPTGSDRFVWLGGLVVVAAAGAAWRVKHWPARPSINSLNEADGTAPRREHLPHGADQS